MVNCGNRISRPLRIHSVAGPSAVISSSFMPVYAGSIIRYRLSEVIHKLPVSGKQKPAA